MSLLQKIQQITAEQTTTVVEIPQIGQVAVKKMTLQDRDDWLSDKNTSSAVIIKACVYDPDTLKPAFETLSLKEIKKFPSDLGDDLIKEIYRFNGILKEDQNEEKPKESKETKN